MSLPGDPRIHRPNSNYTVSDDTNLGPKPKYTMVKSKKKATFIGPLTQAQTQALSQPSKPKTRKRSKRKGRSMKNTSDSHNLELVCGVTDPFCKHALGARWPGESSGGKSMTCQLRYSFTVTSDASGYGNFGVVPQFKYGYFRDAVVSAGTFTVPTYYSHGGTLTALNTCYKFRTVTAGCVIKSIANATVTQGQMIIESTNRLDATSVISMSDLPPNSKKVALQTGGQWSWVTSEVGPLARDFKAINTDTATFMGAGQTILLGRISGATPSTAILDVEVIINVEALFGDNPIYDQLIPTPTPPNAGVVMAAGKVNFLTDIYDAGVEEVSKTIKALAIQGIRQVPKMLMG